MRLEDFLRTPGLPPSPFAKLPSSCIPSDADCIQIKSLIHNLQSEADDHDTEIRRLVKALAAKKRRRDALQRDADRYRAMISPVRQLPVEILMLIFEFACIRGPNTFSLEIPYRANSFGTTNALSRTCSLWRRIVISSPKLWTKISIDFEGIEEGEEMPGVVNLYLRRSEDLPLTLSVVAVHPHLASYYKLTLTSWFIFVSLLNECARWSDVHLDLSDDILNDGRIRTFFYGDLFGHPGTLRSLSLSWPEDDGPFDPAYFEFIDMLGPRKLDSLILKDSSILSEPLCTAHTVVIQNLSARLDIFSVFRNCPQTKHIVCTVFPQVHEGPSHPHRVQRTAYEHIESLTLESPKGACALSCILRLLNLPNLATLKLSASGLGCGVGIRQSLSMMLRQSFCASLDVLDLSGDLFMSSRDLIEVLSLTPSVTHFNLDAGLRYHAYFTRRFFQSLTFQDIPKGAPIHLSDTTTARIQTLLPRLRVCRFSLKQGPMSRFFIGHLPDPEDILRMLGSRRSCCDGRDKLAKFGLSAGLYSGVDAWRWAEVFSSTSSDICVLKQNGLDLELNISFLDGKRTRF
ncbi:hypothetical protein VKT23_000557 [Stygiomarasmius scandens]|uniref:F-box domain-containing protein n=1 Tax=Marasmiellus scandens TaxID=2682957 RepID=A0ABR1K8C1_9AGAR